VIDVSNPEQPALANWLSMTEKAGLVAADRRPDGKYHFITSKNDSDTCRIMRPPPRISSPPA
jgi:hypothetical protein